MHLAKALAALCLFAIALTTQVRAQTPPSAGEIAAYTGVHAAAAKGDVSALSALIAAKADLAARDSHGRTVVHIAGHAGHSEIVRALAAAGADLNALDSRRYDLITIAAVRDDPGMVRLAVSLGASARNITSPYDGTALIAAAHLGHDDVVKALIAGGAPLDQVNNLGWTAVTEAVVLGDGGKRHQETLRALISSGANVRLADRDGVTPLEHAQRRNYKAMVDMLTKAR